MILLRSLIIFLFWLSMVIGCDDIFKQFSIQHRRHHSKMLEKRDVSQITLAESILNSQSTDPVGAAKLVQQIPYLANNASGVTDTQFQLIKGDSNEAQLPWNSKVPFIQGAATTADQSGGWQKLPEVEGFTLNRSWEIVPGAIMPFYSTKGLDPTQVKRALITFPGKPRDAWKYANLFRNALEVVYYNKSSGVTKDSVLIISPFWGDQDDFSAGSLKSKEIYFHGSGWMAGMDSKGPPNLTHSLTSYEILDNFTDMLFDKAQYPNLNHVVLAGHSMGGQASQRYGVLKKQKKYDNNISFWVGNPGSWAFLSTDRPYYIESCTNTYNTWEYGLGGDLKNMTKYARYACTTNLNWVVKTAINRQFHYALGLLDNGPGDTHCQARDQGGSHLDRGSQFIIHLQKVNNGNWPSTQTVSFVGNTSHQDYAMISANSSLFYLFINNYDINYPDIIPWNPIDHKKHNQTDEQIPIQKSYATHGNEALATLLLGGSLILIGLIYTLAPKIFKANFNEEEFNESVKGLLQSGNHFQPFHPISGGNGVENRGKGSSFPAQFNSSSLSNSNSSDFPLIKITDSDAETNSKKIKKNNKNQKNYL